MGGALTRRKPVDLGSGFVATFYRWAPNRRLNPKFKGRPNIDPAGIILDHPDASDPSVQCGSSLLFDTVPDDLFAGQPRKQVLSLDPLELSPSIHCAVEKGGCGAHGFIRAGRWVPA